jgi:hypothetical protein
VTSEIPNILNVANYCEAGVFGDRPGEGIVYVYSGGSAIFLADLDSSTGCGDGQADFWFAPGTCDHPAELFDSSLTFNLSQVSAPLSVCVGRFPSVDGFLTLDILSFDAQSLRLIEYENLRWSTSFEFGVPEASNASVPSAAGSRWMAPTRPTPIPHQVPTTASCHSNGWRTPISLESDLWGPAWSSS